MCVWERMCVRLYTCVYLLSGCVLTAAHRYLVKLNNQTVSQRVRVQSARLGSSPFSRDHRRHEQTSVCARWSSGATHSTALGETLRQRIIDYGNATSQLKTIHMQLSAQEKTCSEANQKRTEQLQLRFDFIFLQTQLWLGWSKGKRSAYWGLKFSSYFGLRPFSNCSIIWSLLDSSSFTMAKESQKEIKLYISVKSIPGKEAMRWSPLTNYPHLSYLLWTCLYLSGQFQTAARHTLRACSGLFCRLTLSIRQPTSRHLCKLTASWRSASIRQSSRRPLEGSVNLFAGYFNRLRCWHLFFSHDNYHPPFLPSLFSAHCRAFLDTFIWILLALFSAAEDGDEYWGIQWQRKRK